MACVCSRLLALRRTLLTTLSLDRLFSIRKQDAGTKTDAGAIVVLGGDEQTSVRGRRPRPSPIYAHDRTPQRTRCSWKGKAKLRIGTRPLKSLPSSAAPTRAQASKATHSLPPSPPPTSPLTVSQ